MSPIVPTRAHFVVPTMSCNVGDHWHHRFRASQCPRHAFSSKRLNVSYRVADQKGAMSRYTRGAAGQARGCKPLILFRQIDSVQATLGDDPLYDLPNPAAGRDAQRIDGGCHIHHASIGFAYTNVTFASDQHVQLPIRKLGSLCRRDQALDSDSRITFYYGWPIVFLSNGRSCQTAGDEYAL